MSGTKEAETAGGTAMASESVTMTPEQQQLEDALLEIGRKEDVIQHLQTRAETAERDVEVARGLIARLGDPDALESLWALLRHERARVAELERNADVLREALEEMRQHHGFLTPLAEAAFASTRRASLEVTP